MTYPKENIFLEVCYGTISAVQGLEYVEKFRLKVGFVILQLRQ